MITKTGETIIWQKDVDRRAYECECSVYKAALEVLARKTSCWSCPPGIIKCEHFSAILKPPHECTVCWAKHATRQARKNLKRRKK